MTRSTGLPEVLLVSEYYWPEPIGSAPYCTDLAEWLAAAGCPVSVLTCRPHYPAGTSFPDYDGGDRDREQRNDVRIERLMPHSSRRRGAMGRMLAGLTFLLRGWRALLSRRTPRSHLVVALCPSILGVLLGHLARRRGGSLVVLVHDIESGLAGSLGIVSLRWLVQLMQAVERRVLNTADVIMVLSPPMRNRLVAMGVTSRIDVVPLWVDLTAIQPSHSGERDPVVALYSGSLGRKQGLQQLIALAAELHRRQGRVRVVIRGEGHEATRLAAEIAALDLDNVEIQPLLPADQLGRGLAEGDIHLVPQEPDTADFAVPSKIFSIMAAGRPFVATAHPNSLLWDLQRESQAFVCVPPGDAEAFAGAVLDLAKDSARRLVLGERARAFVTERHGRPAVLGGVLALIRELS